MLQKWLINLGLGFAVRALAKWGAKIDFVKVKADLMIRVAKLIPGDFLDDEASALLGKIVDVLAALLQKEELEKVVAMAAAGQLKELISYLKQLVIDAYLPKVELQEGVGSLADLDTQFLEAIKAA